MTTPAAAHGHAEVHKDYDAAKIGMWLFLFTELLLFGGLFILFAAYRSKYPVDFHHGSGELNAVIGVANTFVLLTSSLTMALGITAIQKGNRRLAMILVGITVALGFVFLADKYVEWSAEILKHHLYPNSPVLLQHPHGEVLFFGLYFTMTGLHGLHVVAGIIVLSVMLVLMGKGKINQDDFVKLENGGLYWHLVDIIWIFLLPLFYLVA